MSIEHVLSRDTHLSSLQAAHEALLIVPQQCSLLITDDSLIEKIHVVLKRDSRLIFKIPRDAKGSNKTLTFELAEPGAQAEVVCLYEGAGSSQASYKTMQHHTAPDTKSSLVIKGVLHDEARLVCNNLIRIEKGAQRVAATEQNKNLLLGSKARVTTIPKLEVEANDVSCSHGAAVSRLDELSLFYMQSRGIAQADARALLVDSFLT
jgi:Fe-S cluster assembly protein SufD